MFRLISVLLAIALHSVAAINAHSASSNLALSSTHAEKKKIKVEISISSEDDNNSSNEDPVTPIECTTPTTKTLIGGPEVFDFTMTEDPQNTMTLTSTWNY